MSKRGSLAREVIGQAVRPLVEALEQRQMLSASVEQGVWNIRLDQGDLAASDNRVVIAVRRNNPSILQCGVNGKVRARVRVSQIDSLRLVMGAGDDQVTLKLGKHTGRLRADVRGGAGDDVLIGGAEVGHFFGGAGNDTLVGGGGKDRLAGGKGRNTLARGTPSASQRPVPAPIVLEPEAGGSEGDGDVSGPHTLKTVLGGPAASLPHEIWRAGDDQQPVNGYVPVSDAAQLKNWLIGQAVEQAKFRLGVSTSRTWTDYAEGPGPYYSSWAWDSHNGWYLADVRTLSANGDFATATALDHSTTNLQEQGVDEADLTKTDGEYLYLISGGKLIIVDALPAEQTQIVSTTDLTGSSAGLYLDGDRLIVVSQVWEPLSGGAALADNAFSSYPPSTSRVRVVTYDITDRSSPTVVETTTLDGTLASSRMIDGRLYVVLNDQLRLPVPDQVKTGEVELVRQYAETRYTQEQYDAIMALPANQRHGENLPEPIDVTVRQWSEPSRYETEQEFRDRLEALPLEDIIARYAITVPEFGGSASSVFVPAAMNRWTGGSSSIVLLNPNDGSPGVDAATTIMGMSGQVYASADNLYLFSPEWLAGGHRTHLHKFSLGETSITFEASGVVPGTPLNSFSMDEEGDQFRIATTEGGHNNIFILEQNGDDLEIIGGLTGLALTERIYSARFVGDRAYLVTFRQVDPLFVIDLSDPRDPKVTGELKVPGYSSYLHPISENLLLGVGRDATPEGRVKGVQVSLFDVSDPACPKRIDVWTIETTPEGWWGSASSDAEHDHHAFTYFPEYGTLALPLRTWSMGQSTSEVVVLKIDPQEGISEIGTVEHGVGGAGQRNIRIGEDLYSISGGSLKVVKLMSPDEELANVTLPAPEYPDYWRRLPVMPVSIGILRPMLIDRPFILVD